MPVTASLIAAGIGGAQSAFGAYQYLEGRRLAKTAKRPEMEIPREMYNKLTTAQQMALEGMSEQERKQYIDNLQRVANFQMQEMGTRKAGLVGAAELGQTQADALTNMAVQSEQLRRQNQQYLGQTQSEMAGWKQQQFMANKMAPYMATVTAANAMQGAGLQNVMGGAGSASKNIMAAGIYDSLNKPNTIGAMPTAPTTDATQIGLGQDVSQPNLTQGLSSIPTPQLTSNMSAQQAALRATNPDLAFQLTNPNKYANATLGYGATPDQTNAQATMQPGSDAQMELLKISSPALYYQLMAQKMQKPFSY